MARRQGVVPELRVHVSECVACEATEGLYGLPLSVQRDGRNYYAQLAPADSQVAARHLSDAGVGQRRFRPIS